MTPLRTRQYVEEGVFKPSPPLANPVLLRFVTEQFVRPEWFNQNAGDGAVTYGESWSLSGTDSAPAITQALSERKPVYLDPKRLYIVEQPILMPDDGIFLSMGTLTKVVGAFDGFLLQGANNDTEDSSNVRSRISGIDFQNLFM